MLFCGSELAEVARSSLMSPIKCLASVVRNLPPYLLNLVNIREFKIQRSCEPWLGSVCRASLRVSVLAFDADRENDALERGSYDERFFFDSNLRFVLHDYCTKS